MMQCSSGLVIRRTKISSSARAVPCSASRSLKMRSQTPMSLSLRMAGSLISISQEASSPLSVLTESTSSTPARCIRLSRSEEHTSELQSLMRISYAVFCLKKKKKQRKLHKHDNKTINIQQTKDVTKQY